MTSLVLRDAIDFKEMLLNWDFDTCNFTEVEKPDNNNSDIS
jgi:hypothetical protein